jgi:coenzyme F420-reducing hydrogenase beta subunit
VAKLPDEPNARGKLLRRGDDLGCISNSVYEPVLAMAGMPRLAPGTKLLVVGTNCQLQAVEKLFGRQLQLIKVAILCKQQKTFEFSRYLRRLLGVNADAKLEYRGKGWPGECSANGRSLPHEQAGALAFGKSLWRLPACRACPHPLGYGADITLADPWKIRREDTAAGGQNLIIVRTEIGERLLGQCSSSLGLERATVAEAKRSVDWSNLQSKNRRISYYMGTEPSLLRRIHFRLGDCQRTAYERLLQAARLPLWFHRVLGRLPYFG